MHTPETQMYENLNINMKEQTKYTTRGSGQKRKLNCHWSCFYSVSQACTRPVARTHNSSEQHLPFSKLINKDESAFVHLACLLSPPFFFKLQIEPKYFPFACLLATEPFSSDIRMGNEKETCFFLPSLKDLLSMKSDLGEIRFQSVYHWNRCAEQGRFQDRAIS